MTIIELKTQNVKALKAVRLTPEPTGIVEIAGKNGAGKSAVLDAIKWALAGGRAIQERPVRDGQAGASTELDLGDYTIRQDIAIDGKCRLTLQSKDGGSFPQAWLSAATNSIVLEPEEFVRKPAREQSTVLRQLVGLDTS
ncbi:MAG: AAA family ATPase, partial [Myxococcales bacterium]|nr:AAA family ATPase [Myxococcales bacterium]